MFRAIAVCLVLAACAGPQWTKPGVSAGTAATDYADCSAQAQQADRRDSNIEADILASRGRDWEQHGTLDTHQQVYAAEAQNRTGDVLGACMRLRGYATAD
jgi:hypothetical protein